MKRSPDISGFRYYDWGTFASFLHGTTLSISLRNFSFRVFFRNFSNPASENLPKRIQKPSFARLQSYNSIIFLPKPICGN